MSFIIVGYGRVGARTARILDTEGYDVVVVDTNSDKIKRADTAGFEVIKGNGSDDSVLEQAGVDDAVALGGLTGDPSINFAACLTGKQHGCRVAMRISEDSNPNVYERYESDVDEVIDPERLGAVGAKTALLGGNFNVLDELTEGLSLTSLSVPNTAPIVGQTVNEIELGDHGRIYAHGRANEPMTIPLPATTVKRGDRLALVVEHDNLMKVRQTLVGNS
ncbi:TrkA family potassium uptake protein [Haloquadratum walsbyi]|jgi:K+ transport systems, NAD-binding component|uniref:K+ transport system, NAD-binding component n=2 Tax=Haloquadratum walsbyi TaxID=293091 RepID=U1NGQ2_9EURY|nr:TrkA family potassium uptake protein [Haloquadratum walsbyi]ERG96305.1 MAG: K+ transport system, NAD-binding component [Haloquadratum walsbyi J07HQW2]